MAKVKRVSTIIGLRGAFDKADSAPVFCAQALMFIVEKLEGIKIKNERRLSEVSEIGRTVKIPISEAREVLAKYASEKFSTILNIKDWTDVGVEISAISGVEFRGEESKPKSKK